MTVQTPPALDTAAILAGDWQQLAALLTFAYPAANESPPTRLSGERLCELIGTSPGEHSLLDTLMAQLPATEQPAGEHYAALKFTDQLFKNYIANSRLHPVIKQSLLPLRAAACRSLLNQQLPWHAQSGITGLLARIYRHSMGWQPELGRAAERYIDQLNGLLPALLQAPTDPDGLQALDDFFHREQQRINKLEQRLHATETGALHARHASQHSIKTLNRLMAGKQLPANISTFLQGPWREAMRLLVINEGHQSPHWQRRLRLTETLIWVLQPVDEASAEYLQQRQDAIAELCEQLQDPGFELQHNNQFDSELIQIDQQLIEVLTGKPLHYAPFTLIDQDDSLLNAQTTISQTLLKQAARYEPGQWFMFQHDDRHTRAKLSLIINPDQQLLFCNFLGIKTYQYSLEEFAYLLSSHTATPIKPTDPFQATGEKILLALAERYHQHQQQAAADQALQEQARQQQAQARQLARTKALQEAERHREQQQQAQLKAQQQQQRDAQRQHEQDCQQQLNELNIGGMVYFYSDATTGEQCKLAAIIQTSGEYVFVNRQGIKQYALNKQQLTQRLLDGSANIVDLGSNFDNTLEQVVNTIRERK